MMETKRSVGGRPKDTFVDPHLLLVQGEDGKVTAKKCIYCDHQFSNKTSVTRIKAHLGGVPGQAVALCKLVPTTVKEAAKNAMPSSSTSSRPSRMAQAGPSTPNMPHLLSHTPQASPPADLREVEQWLLSSPQDGESHSGHDITHNGLSQSAHHIDVCEDHEGQVPTPNTLDPISTEAQRNHELQNLESLSLAPLETQYMLTGQQHDVREMPLYTPQNNESRLMHWALASQHPMQEHLREDPNCSLNQELLRDVAIVDSVHDASIPQNLLQEGACFNSLPPSTYQEDMPMAESGSHEGLELQHHMREDLQGNQRIISLDHGFYPSIGPQLIESSNALTASARYTPEQPKHEKKRKCLDQKPTGKTLPLKTIFKGPTFDKIMDKITRSLEDDSVTRVGVYGMGGSGKTTILKHIHNLLLEGCFLPSSHVIWITVSQDHTISKLQRHLASLLKVELSLDEDEVAWAASLYEEMQKMRYVLILDDVWDKVDLERVGIPEPSQDNACKLILTTRLLDVCRRMRCKPIFLDLLSQYEAWKLFERTVDVNPSESTLQGIMKEVAKECARLPLAISTVAGSMRGIDHVHEWRYALDSLRKRAYGFTDMKDQVMEKLKFSYYRLSEPLQKCLLSCALYPEDSVIVKWKLIDMLIMEGIIGSKESIKLAYDHGETILNKLENACLLTCDDFDRLVIHDLIRDMCLDIVGGRFLIKCSSKFPPDEDEYTEILEKVSLMDSKFEEICLDMAPHCPILSTLLLSGNWNLTRISDSFFMGFPKLKVLDLSDTSIEVLLSSITNLVSLNALLLHWCPKLVCLPCLTPLKALQQLDLSGTAIEVVPEGLENLVNLISLNLTDTAIKKGSSLVVTKLVKLERLLLPEVKIMIKGAKELKKLNFLKANFANWEGFSEYVSLMLGSGRVPSVCQIEARFRHARASYASMSYNISWNDEEAEKRIRVVLGLRDDNRRGENRLFHEVVGQIPSPEFVQMLWLYGLRSKSHQGQTKENGELKGLSDATFPHAFANLEDLIVEFFNFTKDLILPLRSVVGSSSSSPKVLHYFQNLRRLAICKCKSLASIVSSTNLTEKEESDKPINLPNLRVLSLICLPNWGSIFICPSIEYISVFQCPKLNRLPVQLPVLDYDSELLTPPLSSLKEIRGTSEWWESLEWDQPQAKALLQPYLVSQHFVRFSSKRRSRPVSERCSRSDPECYSPADSECYSPINSEGYFPSASDCYSPSDSE